MIRSSRFVSPHFLYAAPAVATAMLLLLASTAGAQNPDDAQKRAQDIQQRTQAIIQRSQQAAQAKIEMLKRGIVKVVAKNGGQDQGTGVVIASSPKSVTILTALHVVDGSSAITVYFYSDRSKAFVAKKLPRHSSAMDIAVLEVDSTPTAPLPSDLPAYNFAANDTLQITQHIYSVNGDWTVAPNNITNLNHEGDPQKFEYTNVSVGAGFSGGPVFDDYGDIIGMHISHEGDGSISVADKIDSSLQVLEALGYSAPKAGPINIPNFAGGTPASGGPATAATAAGPCDNGCETTFAAMRHVHHYPVQGRGPECGEEVLAFPAGWPAANLFLHANYCPYPGKYSQPGALSFLVRFAETDHQGDADMMLGIVSLTGSSGQGMLRVPDGSIWNITVRNPNFNGSFKLDAVTFALKPLMRPR